MRIKISKAKNYEIRTIAMSDLESHELVLRVDEGTTRGWINWGDTIFKMGLSNWRGGFSIVFVLLGKASTYCILK